MKVMNVMSIALAAVLLGAGGWWYASRPDPGPMSFSGADASSGSREFSLGPYEAALSRYVNEQGLVNYRGLKADSRNLDAFAASLSRVSPAQLESWGEEKKIAFWINTYNALTLEAILRNYPIRSSFLRSTIYPKNSIRQIPGVWDKLRFSVAGREVTLDEIEHSTLRAQFNEPRIHVALVCAALSCPPLRNEPYTGETLNRQLDDQARAFLASPQGMGIDRQVGRVHLSSIFKWFGEDFVKTYGTREQFAGKSDAERAVLNFVSRYVSDTDREFLLSGRYRIEYLDYDWSLNEQAAAQSNRVNR